MMTDCVLLRVLRDAGTVKGTTDERMQQPTTGQNAINIPLCHLTRSPGEGMELQTEGPDDGQTVSFRVLRDAGTVKGTTDESMQQPTIGQNLQETAGHLSQHLSECGAHS